ncbi:DUF6095 family protein [Flavobacterium kingsejongi]|uniref:Uncharacterized protein n=1 Tax=Flavobacterium kingsejongi TaxID=1678728 RepID=A0A2S1LS85_9FLAO|nr:DUF6095 family protein [Flavobacterium kingsejongi]AWG26584.1 hypothetical protein FK004_15800 [Flavobacterium kingsejongi]
MANKKILFRGIKYLGWSLPLFFIGPVVIHSSFKNQNNPLYYVVLALGIIICLSAMLLLFRGVQTVVKSLFDHE